MNRTLITFAFTALLWSNMALAENQIVTLKDGSQIKGELVSVDHGTYTVSTPAMGALKVSATEVASITSATGGMPAKTATGDSAGQNNADLEQKIQSTQNKLMADPQMMSKIQEMMQDPEVAALISDPSLAQAAASHDVNAIQNNPKTQKLINNPKMRALIEELNKKQ